MRRVIAWLLIAVGTLCALLGLLCVTSFAFDWRIPLGGGFYVPQSLIVACVLMVGGMTLFAKGALSLDESTDSSKS